MKTIKQIADELGVSKQTIRNTIENLGLQSDFRFFLQLFESQIHEKDKQIEQKDKQIEQLQKLLDQQQHLTLKVQQQLEQLQLETKESTTNFVDEEIELQETQPKNHFGNFGKIIKNKKSKRIYFSYFKKDKVIYSVFFEKNHLSLLKNSISIIRINNVISIPKTSGFVFKNTETK